MTSLRLALTSPPVLKIEPRQSNLRATSRILSTLAYDNPFTDTNSRLGACNAEPTVK